MKIAPCPAVRYMPRLRWGLLACFLLTACLIEAHADDVIEVRDHRPVAKAIEMLAGLQDKAITYEDPKYSFAGDLKDLTEEVRRDLARFPPGKAPRILGPVERTLTFTYSDGEDVVATLRRISLSAAATADYIPFRVEETARFIHVIPAYSRDVSGKWKETTSILENVVTIKAQDRRLMDLISEVCKSLSSSLGSRVEIGTVPINTLMRTHTEGGATNESARSVLERELGAINPKLTWLIFYDPTLNWYVLNIRGQRPLLSADENKTPESPAGVATSSPLSPRKP